MHRWIVDLSHKVQNLEKMQDFQHHEYQKQKERPCDSLALLANAGASKKQDSG